MSCSSFRFKQWLLTGNLLSSYQSHRAVIAFTLAKRGTAFSLNARAVSPWGGLGSLPGRCKRAPMQQEHVLHHPQGLRVLPARSQPLLGGPSSCPRPAKWRFSIRLDQCTQNCALPEHGTMGRSGRTKHRCPPEMGNGVRPPPSEHAWGKSSQYRGTTCPFPSTMEHKCRERFSFKARYATRHSKKVPSSSFPSSTQPCSPPHSPGSWKLVRRSPGDFLDEPASLVPRGVTSPTLSNKDFQVTQLLHGRDESTFIESIT